MHLFRLDDDEPVNKIRVDSPNKEILLINDIFAITVSEIFESDEYQTFFV